VSPSPSLQESQIDGNRQLLQVQHFFGVLLAISLQNLAEPRCHPRCSGRLARAGTHLSPAPNLGRCDHSKRSLVQMVEKGDAAVWGQRFQLDNSLSASLLSGTVDPGTSCTRFHAASSSFSLNILQCEIQLRGVPQFHCTTSSSNRRNDSFFHRPLCGLCSPAPVLVATAGFSSAGLDILLSPCL